MRVGVYVDGFNLYYGARAICGEESPGWRWLDLRALAASLIGPGWRERGAEIHRVVYCTARLSAGIDPVAPTQQDVYLRALDGHGSVDHVEFGAFVSRVKVALLADRNRKGPPQPVGARWPVQIKDSAGVDVPDARFMVSCLHTEEKGSDVNVVTHLLLDVLQGDVDAAIVITNDSDFALPLHKARERVPIGTVNPGLRPLAGKLRGEQSDGVGGHWWGRITEPSYRACQLPERVGTFVKPAGW